MTLVATSIPEDLALYQGEEIQFQALVQPDGSLLMTRMLHRERPAAKKKSPVSLAEWGRKWAGSMALGPNETFEELKRAAYEKKFDL